MAVPRAKRSFDLVLFGATGFAGRLTAEYLARTAPAELRWAIAGRNRDKLFAVREALADGDPALSDLPVLIADSADAEALSRVAGNTRLVVTTVGPYVQHGEPLVAACAEAGTDYLDLTGEREFVDSMYLRHHDSAVRTGARLIHCAGFDSIPHDLGAYYTVLQLPEGVPIRIRGYLRAKASVSGGTLHSALTAFSRGRANISTARRRSAAERSEHASQGRTRAAHWDRGAPHHDNASGGWAVPLPTIDPQVVVRSARAVERYGPDFTYSHFFSFSRLRTALTSVGTVGGVLLAAQLPPLRALIGRRIKPGDGPSLMQRRRSWFTVTFTGTGGGASVVTRVGGGDPGYDETAKMLAESAYALLFDDVPETSGQVTTVTAMGDALLVRLQKAGIRFEVIAT